jgi:hypothetical protein
MKTTKGTSLRIEYTPELLAFPSFDRRKIDGAVCPNHAPEAKNTPKSPHRNTVQVQTAKIIDP